MKFITSQASKVLTNRVQLNPPVVQLDASDTDLVPAKPTLSRPSEQEYTCLFYPKGVAPGSDILEVKDFTVCLDKFQIKWAIRALIFAYAGFVLGTLSITTGAGSTIISKAATAKIALTAAEKTGIELQDLSYVILQGI